MKHTRRKELKTNELSVYLQQIYEAAARNATYLIGGVVVVVLVLVIGLLVQRNRNRAELDAWNSYSEIRSGDVVSDPALLDRARGLAAGYGDNSDLGPLVLELQASLGHQRSLSTTRPVENAPEIKLLKEARGSYERLLEKFGQRADVAARARMSLASVEETLLVAGQGNIQTVRKHYQQVIDAEPNPYQDIARDLLANLEERVARLEIVAPAELPASEPAATTKPAPDTKPAPAAKPATMPATTIAP